jgi:hypothetical protein
MLHLAVAGSARKTLNTAELNALDQGAPFYIAWTNRFQRL